MRLPNNFFYFLLHIIADVLSCDLDPRSKWSLTSLLKRLPMSKIIASHDLELVKALCQRAIILDHGQIIADGTTNHILADIPLLRAHGLAPAEAA